MGVGDFVMAVGDALSNDFLAFYTYAWLSRARESREPRLAVSVYSFLDEAARSCQRF